MQHWLEMQLNSSLKSQGTSCHLIYLALWAHKSDLPGGDTKHATPSQVLSRSEGVWVRAERRGDISLEFPQNRPGQLHQWTEFTDVKPEEEQHSFGGRDLGRSFGFFLRTSYSSLPFPTLFPTAHLPCLPNQTTTPSLPCHYSHNI